QGRNAPRVRSAAEEAAPPAGGQNDPGRSGEPGDAELADDAARGRRAHLPSDPAGREAGHAGIPPDPPPLNPTPSNRGPQGPLSSSVRHATPATGRDRVPPHAVPQAHRLRALPVVRAAGRGVGRPLSELRTVAAGDVRADGGARAARARHGVRTGGDRRLLAGLHRPPRGRPPGGPPTPALFPPVAPPRGAAPAPRARGGPALRGGGPGGPRRPP